MKSIKTKIQVPCEVFTRVCGFYRPVNHFNPGKKEEYNERKLFKVEILTIECNC